MTYFELMEQSGQTNIFDFIPTAEDNRRNKAFFEGDNVQIRYYVDEYEFIKNVHPELLETGIIIGIELDFYIVQINEIIVHVEGSKLKLV